MQMERRALERMVKSLQGGTTFYQSSNAATTAPSAAVPPTSDISSTTSSTSSSSSRKGSSKGHPSKKEAIIAEQSAKRLQEKLDAALKVWDAPDGPGRHAAAALKAADDTTSSSRASPPALIAAADSCNSAVMAVDAFTNKLHSSLGNATLVAQAAVAKLALLHAQLLCRVHAAARQGPEISTADSCNPALRQLLLAVQSALKLTPQLQQTPVPLPTSALTISSKHSQAAPVQAAAAALTALGYSAEASAMLCASGFDSNSITYKTSKPFGFKPVGVVAGTGHLQQPSTSQQAGGDETGCAGNSSSGGNCSNSHCCGGVVTASTGTSNSHLKLPSWQRLQLQLLPHLLRRESGGRAGRDPRISGFVPDEWQRRLLDVVDQGGLWLSVMSAAAFL